MLRLPVHPVSVEEDFVKPLQTGWSWYTGDPVVLGVGGCITHAYLSCLSPTYRALPSEQQRYHLDKFQQLTTQGATLDELAQLASCSIHLVVAYEGQLQVIDTVVPPQGTSSRSIVLRQWTPEYYEPLGIHSSFEVTTSFSATHTFIVALKTAINHLWPVLGDLSVSRTTSGATPSPLLGSPIAYHSTPLVTPALQRRSSV